MPRLSSVSNPHVKKWRALAHEAAARRESGLVLVEGTRFVEAALRAGARVEALLHLPDADRRILDRHAGALRQAETFEVTKAVMRKCSATASPPPVAAIVQAPAAPKHIPEAGKYVVLCGMQDPGNVGAILRAAHGAGWRGAILLGDCADPFSPKAIRASAGSAFFVEVRCGDVGTLAAWKARGARFLAAAAREGKADFAALAGIALGGVVIGSEAHGISDDVRALCDGAVRIPLAEGCESLNAAQAAAVLMFGGGE